METKVCKYCKEKIDKKAKRCPKCGGKFGIPAWAKIIIILAVIFGCVIACVGGCTKAVDDAIDETTNSYKDINGKTSFKQNESFQNKYEKITMTEVNTNFKDYDDYLGPANGKKYIMTKFEVENVNEENDEIYVSSWDFNAYADGVAVEETTLLDDNYNDLSATIGKGKKAVGYIFYEVPTNAQKITIEYNADFWSEGNVIEFVIE